MNIDKIIATTLKHEGGYVNHPDDPGGHTNMGITLATYQQSYPEATVEELKNLTVEQATEFYRIKFYERFQVELLPECVQDIYFDMLVNHGKGNADKILQRGINVCGIPIIVDGKVGTKTRAAAKRAASVGCEDFREAINDSRQQFYNRIITNRPNMKVFARGWRNRVNSFRSTL